MHLKGFIRSLPFLFTYYPKIKKSQGGGKEDIFTKET